MPIKPPPPVTDEDISTEEKFTRFFTHTLQQTDFCGLLDPEYNQKGQVNFLMIAASRGYTKIANFLTFYNPQQINAQDRTGHTALMSATQFGHMEIIKILINHGADINIKNKLGKTALDYAYTYSIKHYIPSYLTDLLELANLTLPQEHDSDTEILGLPSNDSAELWS